MFSNLEILQVAKRVSKFIQRRVSKRLKTTIEHQHHSVSMFILVVKLIISKSASKYNGREVGLLRSDCKCLAENTPHHLGTINIHGEFYLKILNVSGITCDFVEAK